MISGRLLHLLSTAPWAMHEPTLQQLSHNQLSPKGTTAEAPDVRRRAAVTVDGGSTGTAIAIIRVRGAIDQHDDRWIDYFGGTSTERIARHFRAALGSPEIGTIVFDVDSPGGSVFGTPELAAEIYAARGRKRIVSVANSFAASAAYWIAAAADEIVVTPSGEVGSIGCWMVHFDYSKYLEQAGITPTVIRSGAYKAEANPYEPLGQDALEHRQAGTDRYHTMFVNAVAKYRGVSAAVVRKTYGEGRMVGAKDALDLGMVDAIGTIDETVARLLRTSKKGPRAEEAGTEEPSTVTASGLAAALMNSADVAAASALVAGASPALRALAEADLDLLEASSR